MKNGFFKSRNYTIPLFLLSILCLPGCASFLQFGDHGEDSTEYDRGYEASEQSTDGESVAASREEEGGSVSNELEYGKRRVKRAIASRDVVLGMTRREVSDSWGHPTQREVAGRGDGGHERWTYGSRFSLNGSRTVIFENGRVAGWSQ